MTWHVFSIRSGNRSYLAWCRIGTEPCFVERRYTEASGMDLIGRAHTADLNAVPLGPYLFTVTDRSIP